MVGHFQEFEDEYLETMYEFHEESPGAMVKTGDLAKRLTGLSCLGDGNGPALVQAGFCVLHALQGRDAHR